MRRAVTFTQLRAFALVAELGSLHAAAAALGVSEPAVSAAVAALRRDLGDRLFVRTGSGIALTPGGRALAGHARELVRLAERTRRDVARAASAAELRVLAASSCAEHLPALLSAFTDRVPGSGIDLTVGSHDAAADLGDDRHDIALGHWPLPLPGQQLESVPFLRYRRALVAAPCHPLAGRPGPLPPAVLVGQTWLTGPDGVEPGSGEARWASGCAELPEPHRMVSEAAALDAVRSGHGVALALLHVVSRDLRRGDLVPLPVEGTPVTDMWWSTIPGQGAATSAARALQRFLTTPDATTALLARPPRARRAASPVKVQLWS